MKQVAECISLSDYMPLLIVHFRPGKSATALTSPSAFTTAPANPPKFSSLSVILILYFTFLFLQFIKKFI